MSINRARRWRIIRNFALGWMGALVFLTIVRGVGTTEVGSYQETLPVSVGLALVFGAVFGALAGAVQILLEERAYRRIPLRRLLGLRMLFALASLTSLVFVAWVVNVALLGSEVGLVTFFIEPGSLPVYLYILTADFLILLTRQIDLMLGDGNLGKLLRGRFYAPREEDRAFLFVDLTASTAHAETLGHIDYSRMIQDCFDDLAVTADDGAQVYQYVGDGAVLTWPAHEAAENGRCVRAFERFRARLAERDAHYRARYGRSPEFTAGLHAGRVVVTEVGRHKREIAFHGDAINTAARIQGQCREFDASLVVSDALVEAARTHWPVRPLGDVTLRGRSEPLELLAVDVDRPRMAPEVS